jgi:hypothetical protein
MKNKYIFYENRITALLNSGNYNWVAFLGNEGISTLYKTSIFDPDILYFDVDLPVDEVTSIIEDTTYLYLSVDDVTYLGAKVTKDNPSEISYFIIAGGINEKSIDLINDSTYIYFLTPGIETGENSKIVKYNKISRVYVETIDLVTVFNAKKIDIDGSGNIFVVTDNDPIELVKVWFDSFWQYQIFTLS